MKLVAVGVSHRTAPVELREAVDFSRTGFDAALTALALRQVAREAVVVSTCNRAEIYAAADADVAAETCARFIADYHALPWDRIAPHIFVLRGSEAARHLFRVAAGLDSLVVGEPQILGQVKEAFAAAAGVKHTGALTNRLFNTAFTVGKRVRAETGLGEGAVSVSYAAIALARKIFRDLKGLNVLILGAGEMAELTGVHLRAQQVKQITIASRTLATAEALALQLGGRAVAWTALTSALTAADIVVTATGATEPVLTKARIEEAMRPRRGRPLFIIDIAVPRDVEAEAGSLDQVFLYNIDDLQTIVQENMARRTAELERAETIVTEELERFTSWMQSREIVPTVIALRQRFETIRQAELLRLEPKIAGLPPEARARLDEITHLIIEKLLLTPTEQLKAINDETMAVAYADALNRLFSLTDDAASERRTTPTRGAGPGDPASEYVGGAGGTKPPGRQ
ncbi:MAG TPA: glutamyl-tRNA reductase [Vicinamibacterales bacterium]|jgi:glutamyl-tRNA reductase|nr:glutamyl-tRNA reductase [Vicinamibacterales bacterium]